jgi:hypothetical protein
MKSNPASKIVLHVPVIESVDSRTDAEKIEAAKAEAKRVAGLTNCSHEDRKRIFESVFRRQCEQSGVKISSLVWKNSDTTA